MDLFSEGAGKFHSLPTKKYSNVKEMNSSNFFLTEAPGVFLYLIYK